VGDYSHFVFRQKLLGEDGSVRRGVVMFSPKFGATSWHVFTQSPQNVAVEPGIHSLAYWDRCFALPQLLYRWPHQSGIFWIPPRIGCFETSVWNYHSALRKIPQERVSHKGGCLGDVLDSSGLG
jgi:hypothetical protein